MTKSTRTVIVAGNWKMYKTIEESVQYVKDLVPFVKDSSAEVYIAVPYTAIQSVAEAATDTNVVIGAQNMNDASEGAFTGEVAASMLKEAGAKFVLLGHSERRLIFNEDSAFVNKKVKSALAHGLQPIVCVGETLEQREQKKTEEVLESQISESLRDLSADQLSSIVLAYEPVWAIGTGKTATPNQAQEMHKFCRDFIQKEWTKKTADVLPILYGGSVKPNNAKELIEQSDIDGVLVGGASLSVESFSQIVNYQTVKV